MRKIWIKKCNSFRASEEFDRQYYARMSPEQRLEIVQFLREIYYKFNRQYKSEDRKRLRRVVKIIQPASR